MAWAPGPGPQAPGSPGPKPRKLGLLHRLISFRQVPTKRFLRSDPCLGLLHRLAPLDFRNAVPPKNIVPVIVTSEDSASRVTSITHWPVLASGVVIVLANYRGIFCRSQVIEKSYPLALQAPTSAAAVSADSHPFASLLPRIFRTTKHCGFELFPKPLGARAPSLRGQPTGPGPQTFGRAC